MSEFDKEAEREKLREKYERDEEDREATARMSDLLLKGATMTNAHCGTCGDPIFRHEGEEFCPSCQEVVVAEGQEQGSPESASETAGPETGVDEAGQPPEPTDSAATADADTGTVAPDTAAAAGQTAGDDQQSTPTPATPSSGTEPTRSPSPDDAPDATSQQSTTSDGSLASARASLTRTVTRLAQQAEASDDLERARAYLAATEEAADALAAVKQADR